MSVQIRKIEIYNFRSIRSITIKPADLAVLVGNNDVGKSNILRALNLFFNDETNAGEPFSFVIDHNVHNNPNQRAKEVRVRLELTVPPAYVDTNGDYVVWEKTWRKDGQYVNSYEGVRVNIGPRGGKTLERVVIPARSNLHGLLRNIKFFYVPAIKDRSYLSRLRAGIYQVIAEVAAERFRISSGEFERSIADHLSELTDEVTETLGFNSRLALPRDLSHIFESLDFMNDESQISLNERGDGVKTRHIPVILKFMADKKHSLLVRGAQPYSFIWGYEEPENNLELSSAIKLADQFLRYLDGAVSQVLLTTHSPVFYNLHLAANDSDLDVTCHHVFRDEDSNSTKETTNSSDIDEHMGTMALFAPKIVEITNQIRQDQEALETAKQQFEMQRCHLYVEGESDRIVISKAFEVFKPEYAGRVRIITKESGAGHGYVQDMLSAWRHTHKHNPDRPKSAGVVDADGPGKTVKNNWNSGDGNCLSAKCFVLPVPAHIRPIRAAGFDIPVVLETLYPREVWQQAYARDELERYDLAKILNTSQIQRVLTQAITANDLFEEDWWLLYMHAFANERKISLARELVARNDAEITLQNFRPLIDDIVRYLFPA